MTKIGYGKSGDSYLINIHGQTFVKKVFVKGRHPMNPNYDPFLVEKTSYEQLIKLGIKVPKVIEFNEEEQYLIKEYIEGKTLSEYIAFGQFLTPIYKQAYDQFMKLEQQGYTLDYFPTNFVLKNQTLYYIDFELNQYEEAWDFKHWGIYYWFHKEGFFLYLHDHHNHHLLVGENERPRVTELVFKRVDRFLKNL
jgi:TP53 regulating kinase and related kinases